MEKIFKVLKKVIFACVLLYGYNVVAVSFNATIPINIITVMLVTVLGVPSIIGLVIMSLSLF
ncbi:MAG: pro-sigmaK processing inhibitor BofA family protein [bacterium]|nr:pro-sigmaK processing inhibitor BofA family protein [bacterium]